jgi:hypothetical protein
VYSLSLSVATPSAVVYLNIRQLEFHRITLLTRFVRFVLCVFETVLFLLFVMGWSFFSLLHPLLQCFKAHLSSIRTCHKEFLTAKGPPSNAQERSQHSHLSCILHTFYIFGYSTLVGIYLPEEILKKSFSLPPSAN